MATLDYYHCGNIMSVRIADIQKATVNGRKVKLFKVFRFSQMANSFVFYGQYSVPQRTANKNIGIIFERDGAYGEPHA
jgi:hypothetical protein